MPIELPISLSFTRPIDPPPRSPFEKCGQCQFITVPPAPNLRCPRCGQVFSGTIWPAVALNDIWHDLVFCWNHEKAELATVTAAFFFEAAIFDLIYWATCWLHPRHNWIDAAFDELPAKRSAIRQYLKRIDRSGKTNNALKDIFGLDGEQMLQKALGEDARPFYAHYLRCRALRNQIAHRGGRIHLATVPSRMETHQSQARDAALRSSLAFVPQCWVVFSRVWNEFVHTRMLRKHFGSEAPRL